MKKYHWVCLMALLLLLSLAVFPACAEAEGAVTVHTVDELIAAVAPGAEIHLAAGDYALAGAVSYGKRTGNPYVKWEDLYGDEYALVIHDVDGLSIIGEGKYAVQLTAQSPEANVLTLEDCSRVTLSGFTGGHTEQAEGCSAAVVRLWRCENILLEQLGLYGCGAVGIDADRVDRLTIRDSEIYDCSHCGIQLYGCTETVIRNCCIHDLGKTINGYPYGYAALSIGRSRNVDITECEVLKSTVHSILSVYDSQEVRVSSSTVSENAASSGIFQLTGSDVIIETSNAFAENSFSHWYALNWDGTGVQPAVNELGEEMFPEDPEPVHSSSAPVEPLPVITREQKRVYAATVDEFLAAIDSDTEIVLTESFYDLSAASDYGTAYALSRYTWEEVFDGFRLVIRGVENFSIVSDDGEKGLHVLSAVPRYADVLTFLDCSGVMVSGFTAGHTEAPSLCAGGVLYFERCESVLVDSCNLYGCGILGVTAGNVTGIQITNSCIYECSCGGIFCSNTDQLTVGGCAFWDLGGDTFQLSDCSHVVIDGREIGGTYYGD